MSLFDDQIDVTRQLFHYSKGFKLDINTIIKKLKLILSKNKLNQLGKSTGFTQRKRNVSAFQLIIAMICALGEKETRYLSDILRYFNYLTNQNVKYKPFHNQYH